MSTSMGFLKQHAPPLSSGLANTRCQRAQLATSLLSRSNSRLHRTRLFAKKKKGDDDDFDAEGAVATVVKGGSKLVNMAAEYVPESVPRPVARGGVAIAGGLIAFWLVQKVLSGMVTLALLGGVAYYFLNRDSGDDGGSKGGKDDLDDPLAEARRIIKKYK